MCFLHMHGRPRRFTQTATPDREAPRLEERERRGESGVGECAAAARVWTFSGDDAAEHDRENEKHELCAGMKHPLNPLCA